MTEDDVAALRDRRPAAQRLRDAARELFYKQGIRATGIEEVCRVAGTTKMSLYRAYPSKDALVEAILREECSEATCWYDKALDASVPAQERPLAYIRAAAEVLRTPGFRGCPMGLAIMEFPDPEHPARRVANAEKLATRERLRQLCADAGAAEADALGDVLLLLIEGAFAAAPYLGAEPAAAALVKAGQTLLGGLAKAA